MSEPNMKLLKIASYDEDEAIDEAPHGANNDDKPSDAGSIGEPMSGNSDSDRPSSEDGPASSENDLLNPGMDGDPNYVGFDDSDHISTLAVDGSQLSNVGDADDNLDTSSPFWEQEDDDGGNYVGSSSVPSQLWSNPNLCGLELMDYHGFHIRNQAKA